MINTHGAIAPVLQACTPSTSSLQWACSPPSCNYLFHGHPLNVVISCTGKPFIISVFQLPTLLPLPNFISHALLYSHASNPSSLGPACHCSYHCLHLPPVFNSSLLCYPSLNSMVSHCNHTLLCLVSLYLLGRTKMALK